MDISVQDRPIAVSVVAPVGRLDALAAPALRERCLSIIASGTHRLVIDLSEVTFLDSAGLAVLVSALKHARAEGGDVKLVAPAAEAVTRILSLTRFDTVFDIRRDQANAVNGFTAAVERRPRRR